MSCFRCGGDLGGNEVWKICYVTIYDKCRGKVCPDCGKVRKVVKIESIYTENFSFFSPCTKCKRINNYWVDKLCSTCFLERERKRGCVCFFDKDYNKKEEYHTSTNLYCSLCDEPHPCREGLCKKCFEKLTDTCQRQPEDILKEAGLKELKGKQIGERSSQVFSKAVLSSVVLVISFFLGWLFFRGLRKKRKRK